MNRMLAVLCLGFLGLTGCNQLGLAFRWADTYIASKVDDYFDISSKQSASLKDGIKKDLNELKSDLLPQWVARFRSIQSEVQKGNLNPERTQFYFDLFMKDIEHINGRFSDTANVFISNTNNQQLDFFAKAFQKKTREDLQKFQKTVQYQKEMRGKYLEYFKMFLGSLNNDQQKMIEAHLAESPFPGELKARNKVHIISLYLQGNKSAEARRDFLKQYYNDPAALNLPEYQSAYQKYQGQLKKLVIQMMATITDKQKKNLIENLNEKTAQLERIAKAG
ncbi:DUF6279 family lipoprotein [Bdellovibrio bacteriovorus]|uniref:DUF6279 family lipoprotein n=1 Tax=Bdellovibrio bacteriovorus TaxID=959 RepID=UPI0021D3BFD6|nr:DUF6279 family lipoprotein [Bdellovibrio bacteriovorus]UXR64304.1 DUF6279 family lipoprotein [Bdellovibrio bacteriovorus]